MSKAVGCILVLITLGLFWPATRYGFIELDDDSYVSGNPYVQQGFTRQSLAWAVTTVHESYWLPLTWISFMTDRVVQGAEPMGYHRTNVLLHAVNVGLLFLIGFRWTGHLWGSALLAALFGWHPLRIEAVVWISSRKDVLSTCFGLLAILAYGRYVQLRLSGGRWAALGQYLLVFIAMAAGLMAKPMLVTLPFVLLLVDFWPLKRFGWADENVQRSTLNAQRSTPNVVVCRPGFSRSCAVGQAKACTTNGRFRDLLLEKAPLLLLAVLFVFITLSTHAGSGAMHRADPVFAERLFQIPANYGRYLWKLFWPEDLAIRYPPIHRSHMECLVTTLLIVLWTCACFWWSRRWPWALVGWLWFLGTFVPMIGVVRVGTADFADRFTYLPSIGISLLVAGMIVSALGPRFGRLRLVAAAILLAGCGGMARHQLRFWADGEILFRRALQVTGKNAAAHNALGRTLEKQGRWQEAMVEYEESLSIAPEFGQAHANLGNVLGMLRRYDEAAMHFQAALKGTAEDARIHSNYGAILYEAGRRAEGVQHLREAIRLNPNLANAHFNLGHALLELGEEVEALDQFVRAIQINPEDEAAQFQAGLLFLAQGMRDRARSCFEAALRRNPGSLDYERALRETAGPERGK